MSKEEVKVNKIKHIQACIDQEKYNEIWKVIYQHTSQTIPDFTLTEETIKDVLVRTLASYEESLLNATKEIKRLNDVIQEKEKMIDSLIKTNIHISTIEKGSGKDE
jgi:hypothetical protein